MASVTAGVDVRRLAAVDMHGARGRRARAWTILVEFVLGAVGAPLLGGLVVVEMPTFGWRLFGLWVVGIGLNYVPLTLHAVSFIRPGALARELAGTDVPRELRHYTRAQVWVFVPLALVVFALRPPGAR